MSATHLVTVPGTAARMSFSPHLRPPTTRAAAGGFETQYKLEHTLNLGLAKAVKVSGTKLSLHISSAGASKNSMFNCLNITPGVEEDIKALGFDHTIIAAGAHYWSTAGKKTSRSFNEAYSWVSKHD